MYFIIEYVDAVTGIEGEALSWEFAKTEGEATIKARAHLLLFKARFGAQGYRILSPAGSLIAYGPGAQEEDADDFVTIEPLAKEDHGERDHFFTQGLHDSEHLGWRRAGQGSSFVYSKAILARVAKGTAFRPATPAKLQGSHARHLGREAAASSSARKSPPGQAWMSERRSSKSILREDNMPDSLRSMAQISQAPTESKPCTTLAGKRILVVEDDGLIAFDIVSELRRAGCTAIGPALRLETAMTIAAAQDIDAAVLDVFLEGAYAWQLAGTLKAQGVPFLFQTGFGRFLDFPAEFASVPRLEKPVMAGALTRELKAIFD
jgi:CheY-like chemotaxis protein